MTIKNKKTRKQELEALRKRFTKANRMRKRVMVAKDVIQQLDTKKFIATSGTYFRFSDKERIWDSDGFYDIKPSKVPKPDSDLSEVVDNVQCEVCAIGAAFCSMVRLKDKVSVMDVGAPSIHHGIQIGSFEMLDYVAGIFSAEEMRMFERIFEQGSGDIYPEVKFASLLYSEGDDDTRLRLIMENIIANQGNFDYDRLPVRNEDGTWTTPGYNKKGK